MKANRTNDLNAVESTDLDDRDVRALTEYLTVLPRAPDLYTVVSQSGESYTVDAREGVCDCADYRYREPADGCKHVRRVAYEIGERALPAWIDIDALPSDFSVHVDGSPRLVATDGGEVLAADTDDESERPTECECTGHERESTCCWPCYAAGFDFDEPNPNAGDEA